ncbi:NRF domain-containing protein [Caerostris extrusa]|uniref:NRF domain-containing protein n=1 Tax=Caerostris extrusa TaxID=172846 RepID=A0AAV4PEZ9_CAEEX|nr:NRF domain-containing protein [Caerostris extrusa]
MAMNRSKIESLLGKSLWPDYDVDATCKVSWWWNLLYINNFQISAKQVAKSWFFTNGTLLCHFFHSKFCNPYEYNMDATLESIFVKGANIPAVIILSVGWIVASSVSLACVFGLYNHELTLVGACFYNSLNRICYAFGLAWVIFVCVTGRGGVVNSILSWRLDSLSRLTQIVEGKNSHKQFDLTQIVENFANHVDRSQKLKLTPDEEKEYLKDFIRIFHKSIIPMLLNLLMETASQKCYNDAIYTYENLASFNWATKMLDSYGKPESGILLGNLNWIGEYDECVTAHAPEKENTSIGGFHGKYCTMQIPFQFRNKSMPISTAVCLPDTCNPSTHPFNISLGSNSTNSSFIEQLDSLLNNTTLTCKRTSREYTTSAVVVICLLSFFAVLAFIGSSITALEYCMRISPSTESIHGEKYF